MYDYIFKNYYIWKNMCTKEGVIALSSSILNKSVIAQIRFLFTVYLINS